MCKFGQIVLIPFPFTDLTSAKLRPALIISKNAIGNDIIVVFITSKTQNQNAKNLIYIKDTDKIFEQTGLKTNSIIRLDKIATLNKKLILGELGELPKTFLKQHAKTFSKIFGF
ncbi:MAG: type II toxin-antitoxin system PemK/MazF family toxin [Candidatus Gracilibacteria bacterium]|jgi:mRNA interferase MazF